MQSVCVCETNKMTTYEISKKTRIVFALSGLQGGGSERMVSRLANAFVTLGIRVDIILLFDAVHIDYEIDKRIRIFDFGFPFLRGRVRKKIRQIFAIRDYIRNNHPNLIFCYSYTMLPYFVLANVGLHCGCKIVGSQRANPKVFSAYYRFISFFFLLACDGFVFQTVKMMKCYPIWLQKKSVVIGNIAPVIQETEKQIVENAVCSVGRLHTDKDYATLLRAFAQVLQSVPNASLHIYGDGPLKEDLQRMTVTLRIFQHVIFEGFSKTVEHELRKYTIFAFSSKAEGMPNALMEAMAAGLACVATDCDFGPAELIEDGVNGYLVPVGDADRMAERLVYLLRDGKKRNEIQRNACKISDTFAEEKIINAYLDYVKKVCGEVK